MKPSTAMFSCSILSADRSENMATLVTLGYWHQFSIKNCGKNDPRNFGKTAFITDCSNKLNWSKTLPCAVTSLRQERFPQSTPGTHHNSNKVFLQNELQFPHCMATAEGLLPRQPSLIHSSTWSISNFCRAAFSCMCSTPVGVNTMWKLGTSVEESVTSLIHFLGVMKVSLSCFHFLTCQLRPMTACGAWKHTLLHSIATEKKPLYFPRNDTHKSICLCTSDVPTLAAKEMPNPHGKQCSERTELWYEYRETDSCSATAENATLHKLLTIEFRRVRK